MLVFAAGSMKNFMGEGDEVPPFTVQGMIQGHDEAELEAKLAFLNRMAEQCGGKHNFLLDCMAEQMSMPSAGESEMDWMSIFNSFGIPVWMPFTLPRQGFARVWKKLLAWRAERMQEADRLGLRLRTNWDMFVPSDASTLIGEIDCFFSDVERPDAYAFARETMADFQRYAHSLGSIDVYNQGFMADLNASCWSPGFRRLFETVKAAVDPNGILNPGQWAGAYIPSKGD